jgi:hypothetical protein
MARMIFILLTLLATPAKAQTLTALEENAIALSSYCAGALTVIISDPSTSDYEHMLTRQKHFMAGSRRPTSATTSAKR